MVQSIVIENNGTEEWTPLKDNPDYLSLSPRIFAQSKGCRIVGMGGAAFPTHVKLFSAEGKAD